MPTLLGLCDTKVNKDTDVGWSSNIIGGYPVWMTAIKKADYPKCKLCDCLLYHISQIYCPLETSEYHRTLYVFACAARHCWNKPGSVVVWRCQMLDKIKKNVPKRKISSDDWGVNDWCEDEGDAPIHENMSQSTDLNVGSEEIVDTLTKDFNLNLTLKGSCKSFPHFVGYHMYVIAESDTVQEHSTEREMQLYDEYMNREGEQSILNGGNIVKKTSVEQYVKTELKHGDRGFHRFQKKVKKSPAQCLRYEWNGEPLLLSSITKVAPEKVSNCQYCGSERIFELQLMPYMVTCLHETVDKTHKMNMASTPSDAHDGQRQLTDSGRFCFNDHDQKVVVEFGCVYIYTCKASCWKGENVYCVEFACVQADPDDRILT